MKLLPTIATFILLAGIVKLVSCKKEYSCENCLEVNKPPIANAGNDTTIVLPLDSVILNGSASSDADGFIKEWLWTKIAGPLSQMANPTNAVAGAKTLLTGAYRFELKVTDNGGLSAKDTVSVIVIQTKNPPIARAGADQTISLPTNHIILDGTASTDPDNNISGYTWTKIAGPASFNISNNIATKTTVDNLIAGVYEFELKVTDTDGLISRDTMLVTVLLEEATACDNSSRPIVNARLIPVGTLSKPKFGAAAVAAGNKIVFAGGRSAASCNAGWCEDWGSTRVDIYDVVSNTWSTAELSAPRFGIAAVASGNKLFFAGGESGDGAFNLMHSTVDIYDMVTNSWSVTSLSERRSYMAAGVSGQKVLFAGGFKDYNYSTTDKVDIYDIATSNWSIKTLSEPRANASAISIKDGGIDMIYFAGGLRDYYSNVASTAIDIYNPALNTFSYASLQQSMGYITGLTINENIYWAADCRVEIVNTRQWHSSTEALFKPGAWMTGDGQNAVVKDNKIVFFTGVGGGSKFDIYDITTNNWSIGALPASITDITFASIIAVNNTIYIAGGYVNGVISNQVWRLEF